MKKNNDYFCSREIDAQGRIVLPKEVRNRFNLKDGTALKISMKDDCIIIKPAIPGCFICEKTDDLISLKGRNICSECLEKLNEIKKINE